MSADATGLTAGLSAAVSRPEVTHDRAAVLREVAISICDGGRDISGKQTGGSCLHIIKQSVNNNHCR
jgi:hypothetical protein